MQNLIALEPAIYMELRFQLYLSYTTAVRTATVSQLDVTLVGDGHSTTGSSVLSAEQIINHHNKILHGHYNVDNFSMVRNAEEDLFQPQHDMHR